MPVRRSAGGDGAAGGRAPRRAVPARALFLSGSSKRSSEGDMYSVAVSDHIMIAHSFVGDLFGPAQRLHGATYAVEAEFRRRELDPDGVVCDIGRAIDALKAALAPLDFRNLDEAPEFRGRNTTTEFLAGEIFRRLAAVVKAGGL